MKFCMIRKVQYRIDIPQFEHYTWVSNIDASPPRRSFLTTLVWFIKFANGIERRLAHQRWGKRTKNLAAVAINLYGRAITHNISKRCSLALISFGYILSIQWNFYIHQMETFSALLVICAGNSPVNGEFPAQRPVTRSLDVFFDLHLNKRLCKQWWGWWFETPSRPLWHNSNACFQGCFQDNKIKPSVKHVQDFYDIRSLLSLFRKLEPSSNDTQEKCVSRVMKLTRGMRSIQSNKQNNLWSIFTRN